MKKNLYHLDQNVSCNVMMIIKTTRMIKMTVMVLLVTLIASSALQLEMEWAGGGIRGRGVAWNVHSQPVLLRINPRADPAVFVL